MAVRISELIELSTDLSQTDALPIVDVSAAETKQVTVANLLTVGISGAPSSFIDLAKLNQSSTTKLSSLALDNTGVASGTYGDAANVARFTVNGQGIVSFASGVPIVIPAGSVTGLATVATSGTYASLSGLPTLGTLSSQDAGSIVVSGGTISGVTFVSGNVTISGGTISGITDLAIADGGTGASDASGARTNLGLVIGTDVQPYSAVLSGIATQFDQSDEIVYASASGVVAGTPFTSFARSIVSGSTASGVRGTLGLGTMAVQDADSVALGGGTISGVTFISGDVTISGGTISGITDLAIADGGTGASNASDARTNLGLAIDTNVQAYSSALTDVATTASGSDLFFYTTSSGAISSADFSAAARTVVAATTISGIRDALGLGDVAVLDEIVMASGNISPSAVTTTAIEDAAVTTVKIAEEAVTLNKLAPTTTSDVILGRATASGGTVEEIACTAAARSILDDASVADIRTTLGLGTLATQDGTFSGTSSGDNTGDQTITLTGDITGTGTGSFATTIATGAVDEGTIASSAVTTVKINDDAVTAEKLADDSAAVVAASSPAGDGAFIGQQWFNTNNGQEFTWTGSAWLQQAGIGTINIVDSTPLAIAVTYPDAYSATLTTTLDTQTAASVFAGPTTGADAAPTFRAIVPGDLPDATVSTKGIIQPGTGLAVDAGTLNHTNTVSGATISSITFDNQGHITAAVPLVAADIPDLDVSKITTGEFSTVRYADASITASKIADYANAQIGETLPVADHIGQFFFNPLEGSVFLWDGNVWQPVGVTTGAIAFAGTFDASAPSGIGQVATVTSAGAAIGLVAGSGLPAASPENSEYYLVVSSGGTITTGNAPFRTLAPPDLVLSDGSAWVEVDVSTGAGAIAATNVSFSSGGDISATSVQSAIEEVSTECRNADNVTSGTLAVARGGTGLASYTKGDLIAASGATTLAKLPVGTNTHVLRANSSTATGLEWGADFTGTVTTVSSATAALTVATATTTPALTLRSATTSVNGIVQLSDSTSTTSSILAATPTAVKSAYDLAALALPKAGGTVTGDITLGTNTGIQFEGTTDDDNEIRLIGADATADRTITLPNVTGTVITTGDSGTVTSTMIADGTIVNADINASAAIALSKLATGALPSGITVASANIVDGTIVNADINASAAIADTKLDTISTAGKVSGSAITSGSIATGGDLSITNGAPIIRLTESDGTTTHSQAALQKSDNVFSIQTRSSASVLLSTDYRVESNASGATEHQWRIANTEKLSLNSSGLTVVDDLTISDKIIHAGDTNTAIRFPAADTVTVETAGAERTRVDSSGRFLVGTSTARTNFNNTTDSPFLQLEATSFVGASLSVVRNVNSDSAGGIILGKTRGGSLGSDTIVNSGDNLGIISWQGADGTDMVPAAQISCSVDNTPGANDMPGRLVFSTTADGNAGPTEAMRINNAQELLIGYTTDNGAYKLQVNSQIFATSATVATSDGRYKENVATLNGCIDLVSALRPVSFDWKPQQDITRIDEDGNSVLVREGHDFPDGKQVGFIAQEVQEVLADKPWLGSVIKQNVRPAIEDADGNELAPEEEFFGIAEGNLTAVLTAALQEAIAMINALEARIAALEA